jgi:hypothetical protein
MQTCPSGEVLGHYREHRCRLNFATFRAEFPRSTGAKRAVSSSRTMTSGSSTAMSRSTSPSRARQLKTYRQPRAAPSDQLERWSLRPARRRARLASCLAAAGERPKIEATFIKVHIIVKDERNPLGWRQADIAIIAFLCLRADITCPRADEDGQGGAPQVSLHRFRSDTSWKSNCK